MSSDDEQGNEKPLPFNSPVSGIVEYDPRNTFDMVTISVCCPGVPEKECKKGYKLQFLHLSRVFVRNGQRVSPGTVIGETGGAGTPGGRRFPIRSTDLAIWEGGKVHLHTQVRDPKGTLQDPQAPQGPFANPPACDCLPLQGPRLPTANRGPYRGKGPLKQEATEYGKRMKAYAESMKSYWMYYCWTMGEGAGDPHNEWKIISNCLRQSDFGVWDAVAKSAEKLANDPADAGYQQLAVAGSDSVAGYMEALAVSMERYQGAKSAGDPNWTAQHVAAMRRYSKNLAGVLRRDADAWQKKGDQLEVDASTESMQAQARQQLLQRLRQIGVTAEYLQALRAAGIPETTARATMYRLLAYPQESLADRPLDEWLGFTDVNPLPARGLRAILLEEAEESRNWASEVERIAALPPGSEFRMGLPEALQRRASFTRMHRGPFAAQVEGDVADSSDSSIGWHAGDRVYFAWHQDGDQVVLAAFDPAGKAVSEPQVIGTGRWPRIVADGQRVAVAWNSPAGDIFVVRLNDGKQWGSEIQLTGKEAALAIAPGGPLYAATSTGLWKLSGDHFDHVQEANYSQPAIAVDKDGKPHVAWQQNGRIVYAGSDVGEGERPSVAIAPDGTVDLAYISKGPLVFRSGKGGQWTPPDTISAKNPSWPALALDANGGVRLSYIGAAEYGPDALYLVRLPDKQSIMMPSLVGNVTDAWFTTEFDLSQWRSNYRPHDLLLTVNDVLVKMFQNTVPEGRYLFRLNPYQVFTSSGQPVPNRVAIHSWHMNPGHYSSASHYRIGVRLAWSEHYVFAANEEEARRSTTSEHINHDQPDLGIFANAMDLPIEQPKPGRIDIPIMIANWGEAASNPVRLVMLGEHQKMLAAAQVSPLKPGADTTITMPFDYDGKLPEITLRLENNHDFDPTNDSLTLRLWGPKPTGYEGPEPGLRGSLETGGPKVPLELTVRLFNENTLPSSYRILHAFSDRMISKVVNGEQFGPLLTGTYQVAVKPFPYEGQEVRFTETIQHQAGVPQTVQLNSGIRLDSQSVANIWRWFAVDASDPGRVIQWQSGQHPLMALPPGEYLVAMQPIEFHSQRAVWPQKIQVQPSQQASFTLGSGVRLEMPQQMGPLWRWQLVSFGKPEQVVQWQEGDQRVMVVPPGDYQLATQPVEFHSQRVVWPQRIQVQAGQTATFRLDTGVRLVGPPGASSNAQFQIVDQNKKIIQSGTGRWGVELIPPGTYSVDVRANPFAPWSTAATTVTVRQGQLTEVRVPEIPK